MLVTWRVNSHQFAVMLTITQDQGQGYKFSPLGQATPLRPRTTWTKSARTDGRMWPLPNFNFRTVQQMSARSSTKNVAATSGRRQLACLLVLPGSQANMFDVEDATTLSWWSTVVSEWVSVHKRFYDYNGKRNFHLPKFYRNIKLSKFFKVTIIF